jgi:hypothetical protein
LLIVFSVHQAHIVLVQLQPLSVATPELPVYVQPVSTVLQEVSFPTSIPHHQAPTLLQEHLQLFYVQLELTILYTINQCVLLAQPDTIVIVQECQYQQFAQQDHTARSVHKVLLYAQSEHTIQCSEAQA